MAEENITGVQFVVAVRYGQSVESGLRTDKHKCQLVRVNQGIEARGATRILIPWSNIAFVTFAPGATA